MNKEEKKQEAQWDAEADARALRDAIVIRGDKPRLKKAIEAAKRLSTDARDEADALENVARADVQQATKGKTISTRS